MSAPNEKKHRSLRLHPKSPSSNSTSGPSSATITAPPRAALRSKVTTEQQQQKLLHAADDNDASSRSPGIGNANPHTIADSVDTHEDAHLQPSSVLTPNATSAPAVSSSSSSPSQCQTPSIPTPSSVGNDKKIAELETTLESLSTVYSREVGMLSQKLTNELEKSQFWQSKHSLLNQTFLKADTELRLLRHEVSTHQHAHQQLEGRVVDLMGERDQAVQKWSEKASELRAREEEVRLLKGQVRGLKSWVSSSSKMDEQVTDEAFGERMQRLGNGLQNWVITNFRRVKIGMSEIWNFLAMRLVCLFIPGWTNLGSCLASAKRLVTSKEDYLSLILAELAREDDRKFNSDQQRLELIA